MKKFFTLAMLAVALMAATPADAQVKFGVKGGLNVAKMKFDNSIVDSKNKAGWFVGPTIKISLPVTGLSLDAAALYDQRSYKIVELATSATPEEETIKQQSIQIPINVRYGVGLGSTASVFLFAGPQFGFNIGDKEKKLKFEEWKMNSSTFSINVGVGASLLNHLQVTANYNIGCGNTGEFKDYITLSQVAGVGKNAFKGKVNTWQVGVAYFF